ncbi:unnamed protein product [Malus baccata var. baccata]
MPWLVTPFPSLQIVGIAVYSSLVVVFYTFLEFFLGNRIVEITAVSVMFLLIRCTATDPTDRASLKKKNKKKPQGGKGLPKLNYGFLLGKIPWKTVAQLDPLLPFPFVLIKEEAVSPDLRDDISFCALCDFEVKKHSKHCRTCNRCVDSFDHYCRWLNNCIGKKNYTTFILLTIFLLLLVISRFICRGAGPTQNNQRLSIRTDSDPQPFTSTKKQGFHLSKEKASITAEKARGWIVKQKPPTEEDSLNHYHKGTTTAVGSGLTLLISKGWMPGSPGGKFSSPRRRVSGSLTMFSGTVPSPKHKYRNNFELNLMEVSRKLETYISRQCALYYLKSKEKK